MRVELDHALLLAARGEMRRLAQSVDAESGLAVATSPVTLPSLAPLREKATWLHEQLPMVGNLAAIALLLDEDGDGTTVVTVPEGGWDPATLVGQAGDQRFGPGFVEATGLEGEELSALLLTLGSVGRDLPPGSAMTAAELRRFVVDHPRVATALQSTLPLGTGPAGSLRSLTGPFMTAPGGAAEVWDQRRADARELFASLSPDDAAILAMTYPSIVGNLAGVPFANRAHANTVNVVAALADERRELAELREQHARNQDDWDFLGLNNDDLEGPIGNLEDRISLYESILEDDRTIVFFDPAGDGAIAELHGTIDARTRNVGVLVPGTGSDLSNYEGGVARRSRGFVNTNAAGELAMVSWMGGDLPDDVGRRRALRELQPRPRSAARRVLARPRPGDRQRHRLPAEHHRRRALLRWRRGRPVGAQRTRRRPRPAHRVRRDGARRPGPRRPPRLAVVGGPLLHDRAGRHHRADPRGPDRGHRARCRPRPLRRHHAAAHR